MRLRLTNEATGSQIPGRPPNYAVGSAHGDIHSTCALAIGYRLVPREKTTTNSGKTTRSTEGGARETPARQDPTSAISLGKSSFDRSWAVWPIRRGKIPPCAA